MAGIIFYCLDLETNGLRHGFHEICELSILRTVDRTQLTRQVRVENPENSSFDALRIIQKTAQELKIGVTSQSVIADVEKFVGEDGLTPAHRCLVGHNIISFDKKFLWHLWEKNKKVFPFELYLDTIHMSRLYAKKNGIVKPKLNLQAACDLLNIKKVPGMHNAESDTRNCFLLWDKLMNNIDYLECVKRMPHNDEEECE